MLLDKDGDPGMYAFFSYLSHSVCMDRSEMFFVSSAKVEIRFNNLDRP